MYPRVSRDGCSLVVEDQLVNELLNKQFDRFETFHPALKKALVYLAENYRQPVSLQELSQNAFVSPSHLSYLFKMHTKRSLKQILAELRITSAVEIIRQNPNTRITDVSLEVGFGDLSLFEKLFKRYTGFSPRQFKQSLKVAS